MVPLRTFREAQIAYAEISAMTRRDTSAGRHAFIALGLIFAFIAVFVGIPVFIWQWVNEGRPAQASVEERFDG